MHLNIIHIQGITTPTHLYYAKYTDTSLKLKLFISHFPVVLSNGDKAFTTDRDL